MSARTSATGGARAALDGFEYQLDVSVFVALQLMLITKSATRITIEPASEEDLEADLYPATPGRLQPSAITAGGYKLVVQIKLRNSGPWTLSSFKALLKHGKVRQPARCHLNDPSTRYLLITNADATGKTRKLLVGSVEEWPEEQMFPVELSETLPHDPEGRVAVLGGLNVHYLQLKVREILDSLLRVPQNRRAECCKRLKDEVRRRMRGTIPGVWTREDLLSVVRSCGGYLASAPQLESFVPPANYQNLKDLFYRHNAIVITGPSGTGKTLTAEALVDQARQRPSAPEIIPVNANSGPASTLMLSDTGPKLYCVEDPWGQYSLKGGAEIWTEQLPRLLSKAHTEHQYIVTSRSDMLSQSKADERLKRWTVVLDASQYRDGELAVIYDKRLNLLATDMQAKALDFRSSALTALETPLEVDLFFTYMADGPKLGELDRAFFQRILSLAHRDAVEDVVVSYLKDSDQTGESAIVWALLAARSQFDRNQLITINRQLRISDPTFVDGLEKLVNRLVATRHLRQPRQIVSFSHPSVRAGFERFIVENWGRNKVALKSLISALAQLGETQREWALETAALSLKAIKDLISDTESLNLEFEIDSASRAVVDEWIEESLIDPRSDFRLVLQLASAVGSRTSVPSELARWFVEGIQRDGRLFDLDWVPPNFDEAWYARISADTRSFAIANRFIREQLPQDHSDYGSDLASQLDRIVSDLTPAFIEAAHKVIARGFNINVCVIAAGAVRDLDRYEDVLDAALDELETVSQFYEQEGREQMRAIIDSECDEADAEGFQIQHEDDGYAADIFVKAYVNRIRSLGQWPTLAKHSRSPELGYAWADHVAKSNGLVSVEELRAVIAVTQSSKGEERAWEAVLKHWEASLSADLEQRILSNPDDDSLRDTLIECALIASPKTLAFCLDRASTAPTSFVQFLVDMHVVYRRGPEKTHLMCLSQLLESIPSAGKEVFQALSINGETPHSVGAMALSLLDEAAKSATPFVLNEIVPVMTISGLAPSAAIRRWLVETEDHKLAKAAVEAAIRIQDDELARLALDHMRADARMAALEYLADSLPNPLPQRLLEMSSDRGSRVRLSLVRLLKDRLHPDHRSVLVRLMEDNWSDANAIYGEPPSYRIAREAIVGLSAYGCLSDDIGEILLSQAEHTDDRMLGVDALNTAALCCSPTIQKRIWELSFIDKSRWVRVDAIDALIQADIVESDILNEITGKLIFGLAPPLAAATCVLLAIHGRVENVVRIMERIAHSETRRALLLLGAAGLADRDRKAAGDLLALLDPDHPAQQLLDLKDKEKLPSTVLDDLGHIRIRNAVRNRLSDKII